MNKIRRSCSLLCVMLFCCGMVSGTAQARQYALLVGVNDYESDEITDLRYAVADVKSVAESLVDNAGFARANVRVMTSDMPRTDALYPSDRNVLRQLALLSNQIQPEDVFLFYFSGHGLQKPEGHFLATANADTFDVAMLRKSTISLDDLKLSFKNIKAQQVVFVLDACRNDPERGKGDSSNKMTEGFSRDLQLVAREAATGQAGTAVLSACSVGERAWEMSDQGHGVFTYFLLDALQGKAVETDGALTAYSVCSYVQKQVRAWSQKNLAAGRTQTPDFQLSGAARIVLGKVDGAPENALEQADVAPTQRPVVTNRPLYQSPSEGLQPPAGAIVLVGSKKGVPPELNQWTNNTWQAQAGGVMITGKGDNATRREFGDLQLHLEFCVPYQPDKPFRRPSGVHADNRGNSGVFLAGCFEVQICDSFGLPVEIVGCGSLYNTAPPHVNAAFPPGVWQTYDILFYAPRLDGKGQVIQPACITVIHNGQKIHDNVPIRNSTAVRGPKPTRYGPLRLQELGGNLVQFRNIWVLDLEQR